MKRFSRWGLPVLITGLAVPFYVLDPGEQEIFPRCLFYSLTGYYCPGCGSQRAIHSLLHINIYGVIANNFLFLPAVLLIIYHYLRTVINAGLNRKLPDILYMKNTPWVIFGTVIIFWVLRNIPSPPFSVLAPS